MREKEVYDFLQSLLPAGLQFVDPYQDEVPQPLTDWAQMTILSREPIGWSQEYYIGDSENGDAIFKADINRVYDVQFDFYGESAFDNAGEYQQRIQVALSQDINNKMDLKNMGVVENRTFLQENKKYQKRYGFDLSCFVVDTITSESPYFDKIKTKLLRYGSN